MGLNNPYPILTKRRDGVARHARITEAAVPLCHADSSYHAQLHLRTQPTGFDNGMPRPEELVYMKDVQQTLWTRMQCE